MKHTQHGRITGGSLEQIFSWLSRNASFRLMIRSRSRSWAYGASSVILAIARQLGLRQALYSHPILGLLPVTM